MTLHSKLSKKDDKPLHAIDEYHEEDDMFSEAENYMISGSSDQEEYDHI